MRKKRHICHDKPLLVPKFQNLALSICGSFASLVRKFDAGEVACIAIIQTIRLNHKFKPVIHTINLNYVKKYIKKSLESG